MVKDDEGNLVAAKDSSLVQAAVFTNTYSTGGAVNNNATALTAVKTGDPTNFPLIIGSLAAAVAVLIVVLALKRRNQKREEEEDEE